MRPLAAAALLLLLAACGGGSRQVERPAPPRGLDGETRAAYIAEDDDALRLALANTTPLRPGLRDSLELSRLLQGGECRRVELETVLNNAPNWIGFVEHGNCAALIGRERRAVEDFVRAVDLAETAESIEYVVRRVCRAADESGLEQLAIMCTGYIP